MSHRRQTAEERLRRVVRSRRPRSLLRRYRRPNEAGRLAPRLAARMPEAGLEVGKCWVLGWKERLRYRLEPHRCRQIGASKMRLARSLPQGVMRGMQSVIRAMAFAIMVLAAHTARAALLPPILQVAWSPSGL